MSKGRETFVLPEGREKKKNQAKQVWFSMRSDSQALWIPHFADMAVTAHTHQSLAGIWYRAALADLHFRALTRAENER